MFIEGIPDHRYDVAIVGCGPAGIALALHLAEQSDQRILMIESGGLEYDAQVHRLSGVTASGELPADYYPIHMQRFFGGSSSVWTGLCALPERRAFLNGEWPVAYEEILPYYEGAAKILEVPPESYLQPTRLIPGSEALVYKPFFLSPPVRFNEKYRDVFAKHRQIDVLLGHTCTEISVASGSVKLLKLRDSYGTLPEAVGVEAGKIVLACGGIGNARMLQLSGIASESQVGRSLMQHPHIADAGSVELDHEAFQPILSREHVIHAFGFSDTFCRQEGELNFTADFFEAEPTGSRLLMGKKRLIFKSSVMLRAEMNRYDDNAVSLGTERDALDQPRTHIHFNYHYRRRFVKSWERFSRTLLQTGMGRVSEPRQLYSRTEPVKRFVAGLFRRFLPASNPYRFIGSFGHYLGTTRMGTSSKDSVVDKDCKVHGVDNLYIAGSSVFPAASSANPTMSIVAFSLRLADHLAEQSRKEP